MYFDGSRGSFQRLLVCCTQRHYVHVRTSTYYYMCLRTYMDYVLVRTYATICMFAYVSLRQYMNVVGLRSDTRQYVLICKYVGLHKTMTYYVLRAYTYLFGSIVILTYNIRIPLPKYTYQYEYISVILGFFPKSRGNKAAANLRPTRIYVQIRTTKNIQKYVHANTYNNTNNYVHSYVQLWIRNFNTCKYVQDSLLMDFLSLHRMYQMKKLGYSDFLLADGNASIVQKYEYAARRSRAQAHGKRCCKQ